MANKGGYFVIGSLSLCVVALYSTGSHAQYYNYPMHHSLEQRVERLERSAHDIQVHLNRLEEQIRNLQPAQPQPPPQAPTPTQWTCHVESGGNYYSSTKPTRPEATERALEKCKKGPGSIFCLPKNVVCEPL